MKEIILITGDSGSLANEVKKILSEHYLIRTLTTKKNKVNKKTVFYWDIDNEILDAIREDGLEIKEISIDGGMVKNTSFTQLLANTTQTNLSIPSNTEATAIGAAKVAAVGCGLVKNIEDYCKKDMSINVQYQTYENLQNNFLIWKDYLDIMIKFTNKIK